MDDKQLIARYAGRPVPMEQQSEYVRFAMTLFPRADEIADPMLEITVSLDLEPAIAHHARIEAHRQASLTAWLMWQLLQALSEISPLQWRLLDGRWYALDDPPVFIPVATGTDNTFRDVVMEGVHSMSWPTFAERYTAEIERIRAEPDRRNPMVGEVFRICTIAGNLPYMNFTSLKMHRLRHETGRPVFYFGRRHGAPGHRRMPLYLACHHGNGDFWQLNQLLRRYEARLAGGAEPR